MKPKKPFILHENIPTCFMNPERFNAEQDQHEKDILFKNEIALIKKLQNSGKAIKRKKK